MPDVFEAVDVSCCKATKSVAFVTFAVTRGSVNVTRANEGTENPGPNCRPSSVRPSVAGWPLGSCA